MEVATSRLSDPFDLQANLHTIRAGRDFRAGRYRQARDHLEQARDLLRQFAPPTTSSTSPA